MGIRYLGLKRIGLPCNRTGQPFAEEVTRGTSSFATYPPRESRILFNTVSFGDPLQQHLVPDYARRGSGGSDFVLQAEALDLGEQDGCHLAFGNPGLSHPFGRYAILRG